MLWQHYKVRREWVINKKTIKICFVLFENLTNFPHSLASLKTLRSHEDGKFMFPQLLFNIWFVINDPLFLNSSQKKKLFVQCKMLRITNFKPKIAPRKYKTGQNCFAVTVKSLYSGLCRDLELLSSLGGVCNRGTLFQSNVCNLFFCLGLRCYPFYLGVRNSGVSARRELTVRCNWVRGFLFLISIQFNFIHTSINIYIIQWCSSFVGRTDTNL